MITKLKSMSRILFSLIFAISAIVPSVTNVFAETIKTHDRNGPWFQRESPLDRGLIAAKTSSGVFLSWRFLKSEVTGYSTTGLTGINFNVYRDGTLIKTVTDSTNYVDADGTAASRYSVCAVVNGKEIDKSEKVTPLANAYYDLQLKVPAPGITPSGQTYTYSANDMSVGDVDGDGKYEFFVKWDPSNSQDVIGKGYTGNVYIDCYKFDGTLLYRIDLGKNIRAGAHYTQYMVYDFDGDRKAEVIFKTAPGTKTIKYNADGSVASEKYITLLKKDIAEGYGNDDDYRCSAEDYYNHVVDMFMNWQDQEEVKNGHWPNTIQACLGITETVNPTLASYTYPYTLDQAKALTDYFMDTWAPARSTNNKLRQFIGYIYEGPEYLTIFNGKTGNEMQTIDYPTPRDDDGLMWGDYAMARIEPCNRVDRMLGAVAYLDGNKPYAIFGRGYYTRTTLAALSWDGHNLSQYWFVDSGYPIMSNPFNNGPHGMDGRNSEYKDITTQGAHTLCVADVDGDGCDEVIEGACTIDHNGKELYSSFATIAEGPNAGQYARLGHGDSIHVTDIIPSRPGLEIFMCHEGGTSAPYGVSMRDAKTGEVIWGTYRNKDNGRCMIGDINPTLPGIENWSMQLRQGDEAGTLVGTGTSMPGSNANIKWAADMTTQIINGSAESTTTVSSWTYSSNTSSTILTCTGATTNNSTKGNPCLVADVFGDFREELLLRLTDSSAVRIYFNTDVTNHKLFTLMQDRQYRTDVARQNDCYNQPAYTSFYYAADMDWKTLYDQITSLTDRIDDLKKSVDALDITAGIKRALTVKLDQALKLLDNRKNGKSFEAVAVLKGFISQINDLKTENKITSEQASQLIKSAEDIILDINSSK